MAITIYLADHFADAGIAPKLGDPGRGAYLTWLAYYAGVIEPVLNLQFAGLGEHDTLVRTFRTRADVDRRIRDALAGSPYIAGDRFTAADIIIASMGHFMRDMLPKGDAVDTYLARCSARPALKGALAKDSPPAA